MTTETETITRSRVADQSRAQALPHYFGPQYLAYEMAVYAYMDRAAPEDYNGGYWEFVVLSNGGFYMSWDSKKDQVHLSEWGNQREADLSPEAASLAANLFVCSNLAFQYPENRFLSENYYHLLEYLSQRPDASGVRYILD